MKSFLIGLILMVSISAFAQEKGETHNTLEAIINHAEKASLYANKVDWNIEKTKIYELAKDANSISELKPALKYLLKSLGDEHGRIFYNNQIIANYYGGKLKEHQKSFQSAIYNSVQQGQVYNFHAELLAENIGYIRIVGLPMGDNEKMAAEIQSEICKLIKVGAETWIIDLRYNGGGNIYPMAEGLALLIGNGIVGGSEGLSEKSIWKVENNHFYYNDFSIELPDSCKQQDLPKIAVLTSLYTASSGEAVAVIFKGRERTKFFGQKTLGMVTVTDWKVINDATTMAISVSYYKDRNEKIYDTYVDVDLEIPFVEAPLSENDECVTAAINWLKEE